MTNFDYTARDYSTIRSELLTRAERSLPEWTDRDTPDFMIALIDLWAYAADVLHYYIDRAASESFLATATQRESVLAIANLYGYTPNRVTSSTATVTVYNDTASSVTIPAGTVFTGTASGSTVYFYSTTPSTVSASSQGSVDVREGTQYSLQTVTSPLGLQTSNGQASQRFTIYHKSVDPSTLRVYVNEGLGQTNVLWRYVQDLTTASASDSVYSFYTAADGTCSIVFGNGVNGRIPNNGTTVYVTYTVSNGARGNTSADAITTFNSNDFPGVSVVSSTAAVGGRDQETITSLKQAIPRALRTQGTATTLSDFSDLAIGVGGVSKATAQYQTGTGTGGSVTIYAVPYQDSWLTPSASPVSVDINIRESVYNSVAPKAVLGIGSIAVPSSVSVTQIYVSVDLYVKDNYVAVYVQDAVETAIDSLLDFDQAEFGKVLTIGEFYRVILGVEGVDYAVITDFNTTSASGGITANGKITVNDYQLPRKGGVEITTFGGVTPPA